MNLNQTEDDVKKAFIKAIEFIEEAIHESHSKKDPDSIQDLSGIYLENILSLIDYYFILFSRYYAEKELNELKDYIIQEIKKITQLKIRK